LNPSLVIIDDGNFNGPEEQGEARKYKKCVIIFPQYAPQDCCETLGRWRSSTQIRGA
jgi:hypothetical protein